MRLIDADELIKDRVENDPVRIAAMCAPTAYNMDRVIESIKKATDEYGLVDYINDEPMITKKQAKEIIRSRGIIEKPQESPDGKRLREREEFFEER